MSKGSTKEIRKYHKRNMTDHISQILYHKFLVKDVTVTKHSVTIYLQSFTTSMNFAVSGLLKRPFKSRFIKLDQLLQTRFL